jgi:uncharacterized membrane protein
MKNIKTDDHINVNKKERNASLVVGGALLLWLLKKGSLGKLLLAGLAGELIYRGVTGHCHLYKYLDINTAAAINDKEPIQAAEEIVGGAAEAQATIPEPEKLVELKEWNKGDLYKKAQELNISGRSNMTKEELIAAIQNSTQ